MRQITVESRGSVVLARLNRGVTNALNLACVEELGKEVVARKEEKEGAFIECWYSDEACERLREAMEKF